MKKVMILCASHNDLGMIYALKKMNYHIIATGMTPNLMGQKLVDAYIQADYSDKELILNIAKKEKIDMICQCCNDFGVYTAAYVAEKLDLPGYDSYNTTLLLHNKDKFKKLAKKLGLISPISVDFDNEKKAEEWILNAKYPLIIKPSDASAGNGIRKVDNVKEAKDAIHFAFLKSRCHRIVIEPFITGSQHGFCTFLHEQKVVAYCSNNEYSIVNPYRVEIDCFPSDNYKDVKDILIAEIELLAKELKLKDGIFHMQYIMQGDNPYIIEVMRRVPGNMYFVPGNLSSGFEWEYWEARARCGLKCDAIKQEHKENKYYAYKTILSYKNGIIKNIRESKKYREFIFDSIYLKKEGDFISDYMSEPIGFLFMKFNSLEQMKRELITEYMNDVIEMED